MNYKSNTEEQQGTPYIFSEKNTRKSQKHKHLRALSIAGGALQREETLDVTGENFHGEHFAATSTTASKLTHISFKKDFSRTVSLRIEIYNITSYIIQNPIEALPISSFSGGMHRATSFGYNSP